MSCAHGETLPPCRQDCLNVETVCGTLVMNLGILPDAPPGLFECGRYPDSVWPACASALAVNMWRSARPECHLPPSMPPQPSPPPSPPEGVPLLPPPAPPASPPWDTCSCNGGHCSCGCDASTPAARYDACGGCASDGPSLDDGVCTTFDADPRLLLQFGIAAAVTVAVLTLVAAALHPIAYARGSQKARRVDCTAPPTASKKAPTPLVRLYESPRTFAGWQARQFGRLGRGVARRPWLTLAITTTCALAAGFGLVAIRVHGDALTMWLPSNSPSQRNEENYIRLTGRPRPRALLILLEASNAESPPPLKPSLDRALTLHDEVIAAGLNGSIAGSGLAASDGVFSPLILWRNSHAELARDPDPAATLRTALSDPGLDEGISSTAVGSMIRLAPRSPSRSEEGLSALLMAYNLDGSAASRSATIDFERRVRTSLATSNASADGLRVHVFSESALSDDLNVAVGSDTNMILISMLLMTTYVALTLGRHHDVLRTRASLASVAVGSVGLATIAAFGLAALAGVEYNDNVNMAIFVLLGVGIDDAFVIVRALEDVPKNSAPATPLPSDTDKPGSGGEPTCCDKAMEEEVADCIGQALAASGPAILLSSLTNAIAFALGTSSPLPALQGFCAYAAIGMVTDLILQVTFFVAGATIDERRQRCGRAMLPCFLATSCQPSLAASRRAPDTAQDAGFSQFALRLLKVARVVALLVYAVSVALSLYASTIVRVGLQPSELVQSTAPVATFFSAQELHFGNASTLVEVVVQHEQPSNVSTSLTPSPLGAATFSALGRLRGALHATSAVHTLPSTGVKSLSHLWVEGFEDLLHADGAGPPSTLAAPQLNLRLGEYLATPDAQLLARTGDLIRGGDGKLLATVWRMQVDGYGPGPMLQLRATLAGAGLGASAFAFSPNDIFYEQDAIMLTYAHQSLLAVLAAVLAAVFALTLSPPVVILLAACTLSCVTHLIGWMVLMRLNLSSISLVPLLLSVGLCIDYCTHITHAFAETRGDATERVMRALRARGLAVLNAGISTGLSVLLLAWGGSAIFTTFFWMLLGVVVIGLFHALLVLPAALTLLPGNVSTTRWETRRRAPETTSDAQAASAKLPTRNQAQAWAVERHFDALPGAPAPFTEELAHIPMQQFGTELTRTVV